MPEPKLLSPLLDGLEFGAAVQTSGSKSVHLMRDPRIGTIYLLRIFTVPDSPSKMDALIYSGAVADRAEALRYYTDQLIDLRRELETIRNLGEYPGIQSQVGYQITELPDDAGFEVYVLSEYLPSLTQHLSLNAMTVLEALNLGIDLSDALFTLHESGYAVQRICPDNILITPQNRFTLSNISLAALDRLDFCTIAEEDLTEHSAPELFGMIPTFHANSDLYSLGMVLYYIFNGNHIPFVDERTTPMAAAKRRLDGEALPSPMYADYELSEILLKACAFDPAERYQSPEEFKAALMLYMQRNPVSDTLIVPPITSEPEDVVTNEAGDEGDEPITFANVDEMDDDFINHLSPSAQDEELLSLLDLEEPTDEIAPEAEPGAPADVPIAAKKKKGKTVGIICGAAALLAAAAVLLWFFLRPDTLSLSGLDAEESSPGVITVRLDQPEEAHELSVVCSDAYGNVQRTAFTGSPVTFENLTPGTQYAVSVETAEKLRLTGTTSLNVTTVPAAIISSITVTDLTTHSVRLQLNVNGTPPETWKIHCEGAGQEALEHTFSGDTIDISGLVSNCTYTCTFTDADGAQVNGTNTVTFTTEPSLQLESFEVTAHTVDTITLGWSYSGDRASSWTIRCEGNDGSVKELQVSGLTATFEEMQTDTEYTFTLSAVGMQDTDLNTVSFSTVITKIRALTAEADGSDAIRVAWDATGYEENVLWKVRCQVSGQKEFSKEMTTAEMELTIPDLIPQTGYEISILDEAGNPLAGESSTFARTSVADKFNAHGVKSVYSVLYLKPAKENWTAANLTTTRTAFAPDEGIVLAVESIGAVQSADEQTHLLYLIRDGDGAPVSITEQDKAWNDIFTKKVLIDAAPRTPDSAGSYTLEVYFDGDLLTSIPFKVK